MAIEHTKPAETKNYWRYVQRSDSTATVVGSREASQRKYERRLSFAIGDSTLRQIVGRQFNADFITWHNPDEVFPHSACNMSHHFATSLQLDTEPRVGECLGNSTLDFKCFFFFSQNLNLSVCWSNRTNACFWLTTDSLKWVFKANNRMDVYCF